MWKSVQNHKAIGGKLSDKCNYKKAVGNRYDKVPFSTHSSTGITLTHYFKILWIQL